jgi:hypothetical protein
VPLDSHHLLICPLGGGPKARHDDIVCSVLHEAFTSAGCAVTREVKFDNVTEEDEDVDDDMTGVNGEQRMRIGDAGDTALYLDLLVRHPALDVVPRAYDVQIVDSLTPARVQASAESRVTPLEEAAVTRAGASFAPFILDVCGSPHPEAESLINWLGSNVAKRPDRLDWMTPTDQAFWEQRLSAALQRANARSALALIRASSSSTD